VVLFCISLLILCPITVTKYCVDGGFDSDNQGIPNILIPSEGSYEESLPIVISNDIDFANQAIANLWDGNGSVSNPYIIEGVNITTTGTFAIHIGNTTVFFEIRGCLIISGTAGIILENLTHATIWNNTIQDTNGHGLVVGESNGVKVTNNTVYNIIGVDSAGLYSFSSDYCEYSNNTIDVVNGWGILADYSNNCSITQNTVNEVLHDGIRLRDSSENNITLNVITSGTSGIKLGNSHECILVENLVGYSLADGISIEVSFNCSVIDNVLFESGSYSLDVSGDSTDIITNTFYRSQLQGLRCQSDGNYIEYNNFIENNLAFSEFATYLVDVGSNNQVQGNYYDVWTWPDEDEDDIVDRPYPYSGEKYDSEPHVKVFQTYLMHILTKPRLIYPNETLAGEKFWGMTQIIWSVSSDTFGHDVMYNVSISADGGFHWSEVAHHLSETSLVWLASEFPESDEYRFKIVAQCIDGLSSEYITGAEYEVKSHTLSNPTILAPNGGETIFGTYDIRWNEAVESWGLPVTYTVYYSQDAGETWSELISYFEDTTLVWDISGVPDGDQYLIRVVARSEAGITSWDVSDSVFTISRPNITMIMVAVVGGVVMVVMAIYLLKRR